MGEYSQSLITMYLLLTIISWVQIEFGVSPEMAMLNLSMYVCGCESSSDG